MPGLVKYDTAPEFDADFKRLSAHEQRLFTEAVRKMIATCKREPSQIPQWPAALRISLLTNHPGICEMAWSFAGPDGRATFEIVSDEDGEPVIRWRRIGGHRIFRKPQVPESSNNIY
ncbi:MAG: hypothetical protein M1343_01660 [Chloroflexi bacterium]|nr:hypothetical protein [Chloroflexota bacterium]